MTVRDSYAIIKNCTYRNGYTQASGGVFNTLKNLYFEATDLVIYNTTAYDYVWYFFKKKKKNLFLFDYYLIV